MPSDAVSYPQSGYFSSIINDYIGQEPGIRPYYHRFPDPEQFGGQIQEKAQEYRGDRQVLADVLLSQYEGVPISDATRQNIEALRDTHTFTVTTGHQLNIFTGPLYFLYKIITTINLARDLSVRYPQYRFAPVYWMATEDHDFDEINFFKFRNSKISWNRPSGGPVGRMSTDGLADVLQVFEKELGQSEAAKRLVWLFEKAYVSGATLAQATRILANELFSGEGLVILDADDPSLKRMFVPYMREDLLQHTAYREVQHTIGNWKYPAQVNPREINLFYLEDGLRERLVQEGEYFRVHQTNMLYSREDILKMLEDHPERFSPNVILRPLYQEVLLPNLCYIGGGGEIAYWLELKSFFDSQNVTFPILMLRNSALLATGKQAGKADKLGLSWGDLFQPHELLLNQYTKRISEIPIDFSAVKKTLQDQFDALEEIAGATDKSFGTAVRAQAAKQMKGLDNLEKKLLRAERRIHADTLERVEKLQHELFPGGLQERQANFAEFYLLEPRLVELLLASLDPWTRNFTVVVV